MFFKIVLEIERDLWAEEEEYNIGCDDPAVNFFDICYSLYDRSINEQIVLLLYYSFTSLSTVGFGDFHPKSNVERFVIAFFLLFGVAIFSYIMGIFIGILGQFKDLNAALDDGE